MVTNTSQFYILTSYFINPPSPPSLLPPCSAPLHPWTAAIHRTCLSLPHLSPPLRAGPQCFLPGLLREPPAGFPASPGASLSSIPHGVAIIWEFQSNHFTSLQRLFYTLRKKYNLLPAACKAYRIGLLLPWQPPPLTLSPPYLSVLNHTNLLFFRLANSYPPFNPWTCSPVC